MEAGIGRLIERRPRSFVTNGSDQKLFLKCQQKWYNQRILGIKLPLADPPYFNAGRFGHLALERLAMGGNYRPEKAVGIAHEIAEEIHEHIAEYRNAMNEKDQDTLAQFASYLVYALPRYAARYSAPEWQRIQHVEQSLWLRVDLEEIDNDLLTMCRDVEKIDHIYFVGTPDKIVLYENRWWHWQHKFMSGRVDIPTYCEQQAWGTHEPTYLQMVEQLVAQGLIPDAPIGHTMMDGFRKLDPPTDPDDIESVKMCACWGKPRSEAEVIHPGMADKGTLDAHRAELEAKHQRFQRRLQNARDYMTTWSDAALFRKDVLMYDRAKAFTNNLNIAMTQVLVAKGALPVLKSEGMSCSMFGQQCAYRDICAERQDADSPFFVQRQSDYADVPEGETERIE